MNTFASKLRWSRMLGFEQIADARSAAMDSAKLGAKIGGKTDIKVANPR